MKKIGTPCNRLFLEANSIMVLASWEVLIFQIVVSHRPLFNLGVLSGILFSLDLGSFEHLCATPFVSKSHYRKNSMRVVINRNTFTILAKRDDLCNFQLQFSKRDGTRDEHYCEFSWENLLLKNGYIQRLKCRN